MSLHSTIPNRTQPAEGTASRQEGSPKALLQLMFREDRFFLLLSVFIGVFSGLAVVCFRFAIDWSRIYLLGSGVTLTPMRLVLAPTLAGLVIAALVMKVFPLARGSGVNQTKAALYIYNGYIPLRTGVGKFITAALAIGSGHSLGPEDPSLQIGASLASALGRRMNLSRDRMRLIAPVGAPAPNALEPAGIPRIVARAAPPVQPLITRCEAKGPLPRFTIGVGL